MQQGISLNKINDRLLELNDKYTEVYPKFYLAELKYISVKSKLMQQEYAKYSSQPTRDAVVEAMLELTPEYEEYHKLYPEHQLLELQIRVFMQLSKNLNGMAFTGQ